MLARIRLKVPDRPGSLGRVASAIGTASGDIAGVDVLDSEAGQAQDDVVVQVRDIPHLSRVLDGLAAVPGVEVVGVHHPEPPVTGHADLQLVAQVVARPDRSLQTLVDGAPTALGVDWAAIVHAADAVLSLPDALPDTLPASLPASLPAGILAGRDDAGLRVVATSPEAPGGTPVIIGPLRLRTLQVPVPIGLPHAGALVPLEGCPLGLLLARAGLELHSRELWRLGQLGAVVGPCLAVSTPA